MGMNHAGEIAPLAAMAAPDVAIITNIGVAHIEYLGTREAIAREKGVLAESLKPGGYLILNAEDEFTPSIASRTTADVIKAGIDSGDVQARGLRPHFSGTRFRFTRMGRAWKRRFPCPGSIWCRTQC